MRVTGFDFLRGLCAIVVAVYHMLAWSDTATLYSWGQYGVYIFFVLSGASMVIAYRDRLAAGLPASQFLLFRFARLAPLFLAVLALKLVVRPSDYNLVQNASLLFGLGNPGANSLVTGGWSIGIEFAFYLMFPLLLSLAQCRVRWWIAVLVAIVQLAFVNQVLATGTLVKTWASYTQPLAFIAYFYIGCLIGGRVLDGNVSKNSGLLFAVVFIAILTGTGPDDAAALTGLRGVALFLLTLLAVHFAAGLTISSALAKPLGEISYGTYLLHPLAYLALAKLGAPAAITIPSALLASMAAAYVSYHLYEARVLGWVKKKASTPRVTRTVQTTGY
jgi:exopolysaccharide production protein ExoZ